MKTKTLPLLVFPLAFLVAPSSHARPPDEAAPSAPFTLQVKPGLNAKAFTKVEVKNVAAVPGERKNLEATLTTKLGDGPIAGKSVSFRVEGKNGSAVPGGVINAGVATTDRSGIARLAWVVPDLAQANYTIKAQFVGDLDAGGAVDDGNLLVSKGITAFDISKAICGPYKNEPGPGHCSFMISLTRTVDSTIIARPIKVEISQGGGKPPLSRTLNPSSSHQSIVLPAGVWLWTVKAQFEGDNVYQATSKETALVGPGAPQVPVP